MEEQECVKIKKEGVNDILFFMWTRSLLISVQVQQA